MLFVPAMLLAMTVSFTSCFDDDYNEPYNPYDPSNTEAKYAAFVTVRNDSTDSTQYWFEYDFGAKYKPVKNLIYDNYSPINSDKSKKDGKRAYITYNDAEGSTSSVKMVSLVSVTDLPTQNVEVVKSNSQVSSYGNYRMYVNQVNLSKDGKWLDLIVELQSRDAMNDVVAHKVNLIENTDDPDSIRLSLSGVAPQHWWRGQRNYCQLYNDIRFVPLARRHEHHKRLLSTGAEIQR